MTLTYVDSVFYSIPILYILQQGRVTGQLGCGTSRKGLLFVCLLGTKSRLPHLLSVQTDGIWLLEVICLASLLTLF